MMMKKSHTILCALVLMSMLASSPLFADMSLGNLNAGATSKGEFSFSLTPSLTFDKFSIMFNILVKGTYTTNPLNLTFDFSNYLVPARDKDDTDWKYAKRILQQYSSFIKMMHYGDRYDTFYFRYGKLENMTLGDGALLSSYTDRSISYLSSRPGLNLKLGPLGHFGLEFITDDLFLPSMSGGRFYILPFAADKGATEKRINRLEMAFSYLFDPRELNEIKDGDSSYKATFQSCFELSQPMFNGKNGQMTLFADFLAQGPKDDLLGGANAFRFGLWGRTKKWFTFNFSILAPMKGPFHYDYFTTGYNETSSNEYGASHEVNVGQAHLDGTLGFNIDSYQLYTGIRIRSDFDAKGFSSQRILATIRIDKFLFDFLTLDFSYEKTYSTTNTESFFPGLVTLKNVYITGDAQVKIRGILFILSGTARFDDTAKVDYSMNLAMQVVLF